MFYPGLAEVLRRVALGLTAFLFVTRAFYPSEDAEAGSGLFWVLLILLASGIAVVANLVAGVTRVRWSWVDGFVLVLILLVGFSAAHAADRRSGITMAWEWGAMGLLYALARNLPRSRAESSALTLVVVATAVAVAVYGLYQAAVEFPVIRHQFERNPVAVLTSLGITPGTPAAESFARRLLDSNEPFSTFALANSLAGFIVGPLLILVAIGLENLKRESTGPRWWGLILAAVPGLPLLICLLLTKSRSAYVGFILGILILAWSYRAIVPRRWLISVAAVLSLVLVGLVGVGVASRQLDVQILSEAKKSLGYRWEYWVATWDILIDHPSPFAPEAATASMFKGSGDDLEARSTLPFFWGIGPGNFAGPYLRHKLPEASEEIKDPHNALLEVWADAGIFAALAFGGALLLGAIQILTPGRQPVTEPAGEPRLGAAWLLQAGGLGWFGVWMIGQLDPIRQPDMTARWLVLGAGWVATALLCGPIVSRRNLPAAGVGAAAVALAVELQAAGGIGIPSVAMVLWIFLALGQNLRDDRLGSQIRILGGIGPAVGLACGWAVLAGTFYGAVMPGWRSDSWMTIGEAAMAAKPPRFEVAEEAFREAIAADRYATRPWLALADTEYQFWRSPEAAKTQKSGWTKVLLTLDKALESNYRDPDSLAVRRRQVSYARLILNQLPADAKPFELLGLKSTIAKAARQSVRLYPTSAPLRVELAQASADLGQFREAVAEARVALRLDDLMPHKDRKLPAGQQAALLAQIKAWDEQAQTPAPTKLGR